MVGYEHKVDGSGPTETKMKNHFTPVSQFKFHGPLEEDSTNGLCLNDIYLPQEVIMNILSYVPPKFILITSLVCKKWCNIIKSESFWIEMYNKHYPNKAKKLPWYVYYCLFATNNFDNLLKNGNGQEGFKHWTIIKNFGEEFIEDPPLGSDPLPPNIPEFNGHTSCFVTSYYECNKVQEISLRNKRLLKYIMNKFMPHIYVSEWVAGRFDCGCSYQLRIMGFGEDYTEDMDLETLFISTEPQQPVPVFDLSEDILIKQWMGKKWEKVVILVKDYSPNINTLIFQHCGQDTQFWAGHYGSKMAGGVVKILFDSIQPVENTDEFETSQLYQNNDVNL